MAALTPRKNSLASSPYHTGEHITCDLSIPVHHDEGLLTLIFHLVVINGGGGTASAHKWGMDTSSHPSAPLPHPPNLEFCSSVALQFHKDIQPPWQSRKGDCSGWFSTCLFQQ